MMMMIFAKTLSAYVWQNSHQFFIAHSSNCILCQDAVSNYSFTKIVVINILKIVNLSRNISCKFNKFILRIIYIGKFVLYFLFYQLYIDTRYIKEIYAFQSGGKYLKCISNFEMFLGIF